MDYALGVDTHEIRALTAAFAVAPEMVQRELWGFMTEAVAQLKRDAGLRTPTHTGSLRKSIIGNVTPIAGFGVEGVVGSSSLYMLPVELGSRPHWVPLEPLINWVLEKIPLGQYSLIKTHRAGERGKADRWVEAAVIARSIQLKIAARGTPAIGMFHGAFNSNKSQLAEKFSETVRRICSQIGKDTQ